MRKTLIPFVHIQRRIVKDNAIEQTDGKSAAEYIVEREAMESPYAHLKPCLVFLVVISEIVR